MHIPQLPVINDIIEQLGPVVPQESTFTAVQHVKRSLLSTLQAIPSKERRIYGKRYSTNEQVLRELKRELWQQHTCVAESIQGTQSTVTDYRETLTSELNGKVPFLQPHELTYKQLRPNIIWDEGGVIVPELVVPEHEQAVAVEQTRSGVVRSRASTPPIPVIAVGDSSAKHVYESPYIARISLRQLYKQARSIPTDRKALVIGYGAIGKPLAALLREEGVPVSIYDVNEQACIHASNDGYAVYSSGKAVHATLRHNLFLGATGINALAPELQKEGSSLSELLPHGSVLASVSSSNVEFLDHNLFRGDYYIWANKDSLPVYQLKTQRGHAWLLNEGFPVTFDHKPDALAPQIIQLTHGLMLAGTYQALNNKLSPGIHQLDAQLERLVVNSYKKHQPHAAAYAEKLYESYR